MTIGIQLDPEALALTQAASKAPYQFTLNAESGHTDLNGIQTLPTPFSFDADVEDLRVKDGPVEYVSIRILKPKNAAPPLPTIIYIHGAGWVFGDELTHDRLMRELAVGVGAAIVFPKYDRSPQAKYPTAIEECYSVLRWVSEDGARYGLNSAQIAVAGDGVGGNMAAAVTLIAKERGGPRLQCQLLFYPATDATFDTATYHEFAEGYHLRRDTMQWFWDQYTIHLGERQEITASPLRASLEQLSELPTALIITAEADVLRSEGEAYASKLRAAGVPVTAVRFLGTIHDFVLINTLASSAATRGAIALTIYWLRNTLFAQ